MSETLEDVIAAARREIPILEKRGGIDVANALNEYVTRVSAATEDYRTFISEKEAVIRSDKSVPWLRARFAEWQRQGNARHNPTNPRERQYRRLIVPVAARISSAQADAVQTARGEQ
jgi:hypothetical protein